MSDPAADAAAATTSSGDHAVPGSSGAIAPGSVIQVRDEEWLVTAVSTLSEYGRPEAAAGSPSGAHGTADAAPDDMGMRLVQRIEAQGLSELVRDTSAVFLDSIDLITVLDPAEAVLVNDESPQYRSSRLWLEATLRKTPLPAEDQRIALAGGMLVDPKDYQLTPVRRILDPQNLRPRILLADAVGLGKTIEIGLILGELIKRGRGERILIVTPKHVLEQMQHEMWTKFAIPFVRLDSDGIAAIRRTLPATRNPFTYFKRAIISIDTLKSDRYLAHLRRHRWDAVVIDESHNVTNTSSLNNRLATVLAQNTDALVLASATPHNGRRESFAELIRLLEPTAISPTGDVAPEDISRLVVRRHRYSADVAAEVGTQWAERSEPVIRVVEPSPQEAAAAAELDAVWMHPRTAEGLPTSSPYAGHAKALFPWTLAKAFLSSPHALVETIDNRLRTLGRTQSTSRRLSEAALQATAHDEDPHTREAQALLRLRDLGQQAVDAVAENRAAGLPQTGKYGALLEHLRAIGVSRSSETRAVIFAERVATLTALSADLKVDLKLKDAQIAMLHGGMSDVDQLRIVDEFKRRNSPLRVLVTGDVASEGVNLHAQCHHLIHFDLPWSLIRIEQRNGRIDRYGQTESPQITTLVLDPDLSGNPNTEGGSSFSGDIRVLQRLIEKEDEAHRALGDAAALMGKYSAEAEEEAIRQALARGQDLDTVIDSVSEADADPFAWLIDASFDGSAPAPAQPVMVESAPTDPTPSVSPDAGSGTGARQSTGTGLTLYTEPVEYLRDALRSIHPEPTLPASRGGLGWEERPDFGFASLTPPADLRQRLQSLPQTYRRDRRIDEQFKLATVPRQAMRSLRRARDDKSSTTLWPEMHYLGPLHPVLEWADDRALAAMPQRNAVYAVRADVEEPLVILHSQLTNLRGQSVSSITSTVRYPEWPQNLSDAIEPPRSREHSTPQGFVTIEPSIEELLVLLGIDRARTNSRSIDLSTYQPLVRASVRAVADYVERQVAPRATTAARDRVEAWRARTETWQQSALEIPQTAGMRARRARVDDATALIEQMEPDRMITRPLLLVVPQGAPAGNGTTGDTL